MASSLRAAAHGHFWLVGLVGVVVGLVFLIYVPTLRAVSASLLLFAGFHILGGALIVSSLLLFARKRRDKAGAGLDFGASARGPLVLALAALAAAGAAVVAILVAPSFWPLAFAFVALSMIFTQGGLNLRALSRPDAALLPLVPLPDGAGRRALVVNAAAGRSLIELADALQTSDIVALDPLVSDTDKDRLERNLKHAGLVDRVTLARGPATAPPFPDGAFDLVVGCHAYDHVGEKPLGLAQAHRVLKPGGQLLITLWTPNWPLFTVANVASLFMTRKRRWREMLRDAGFEIAREGGVNAGWFVLARKPLTPPAILDAPRH